jgi:uncharacterized membrane protein HdeD (DUF308 family)
VLIRRDRAEEGVPVSTATSSRRRDGVRIVTAARAVAAAALALVITFTPDHSPTFGLLVFGVFEIVQGAIVGIGLRASARSRAGRLILLARAVIGVLIGTAALALPYGGLGTLVLLVTAGSLVLGALEVLSGLRREDAGPWSRDAIVVGGLTAVVGLLLSVLPPDTVFVVGLLGAWGAVVAVYLGIAAVSLLGERRLP